MPKTLHKLLAKLRRRRKSRNGSGMITGDMAALTVADSSQSTISADSKRPIMVEFGTPQEYDFTFAVDAVTKWPGPHYDQASLFAPGVFDKARPTRPKVKAKCSKRKLSQEGGQLTLRPKEPPSTKPNREVPQSKKSPSPVHYYGSLPVRDTPHHLLNLPGEIRNEIYHIICVSNEPLIAHFRPIMKPKHRRASGGKLFDTTKRFPREPALAAVSRQLMKEVLSIFYSKNIFIFQRSENERFKDLIMTNPRMMRKWNPHSELARSLRSIEIHFAVHPMTGGKETIVYTLRRLADDSFQVSSNRSEVAVDSCMCFDRDVMVALKQVFGTGGPGQDLLTEAAKLPIFRLQHFRLDKNMLVSVDQMYRPKDLTCDECELPTLRALHTGL